MAEFMLQDKPEVSPRSCFFCDSFEGPFVNLMTSDYAGRIMLMCAPNETRKSGCAGQITNLIGGLTPEAAGDLKAELAWALRQKDEFEERLEEFRAKLVGVTA